MERAHLLQEQPVIPYTSTTKDTSPPMYVARAASNLGERDGKGNVHAMRKEKRGWTAITRLHNRRCMETRFNTAEVDNDVAIHK